MKLIKTKDDQKRALSKTTEVDQNRCSRNGGKLDFSKINVVFVAGRNENPLNPRSDISVKRRWQELVEASARIWRRTQEEPKLSDQRSKE